MDSLILSFSHSRKEHVVENVEELLLLQSSKVSGCFFEVETGKQLHR